MSELEAVFAAARAEGRGALIGYLPAGYPTVAGSIDALAAMLDGGVDLVEVGVPYSDPVLDGPVIQDASRIALQSGFRLKDTFTVVEALAARGAPVVVMTYWNPVYRYGVEAFARDLAAAGGQGLITPDLIPDEAGDWCATSQAHGLHRTFLVSPASSPARIERAARASSGFLYATAVMGVTGAREQVGSGAGELVATARGLTELPIGVGLGVRSAEQAREVASFADAVIVGSAFVAAAGGAGAASEGAGGQGAGSEGGGPSAVAELAAELARGVRT